ncbi:META domain-containing protein [Acinetobacter sp. WU_MDCI_Abxe161]|jgi:heat shock protein HslJ|nr:META domain-containing protein [Acinetobacter sp. WU_MDCI_Abxe161]
MKIKYLVLALLPLSLMACHKMQNEADNVVSQVNTSAEENLSEYNWTYQGAKASKPLVLSFAADQKLSIQTGCNIQGGTWKVEGDSIVTSPLVSTLMACVDNDLKKQEGLAIEIFSEKKVPFEISTVNDQAILTVTDSKGQKHVFAGTKLSANN